MTYKNYSLITWCTKQIDPPHRFQKLTSTFLTPKIWKNYSTFSHSSLVQLRGLKFCQNMSPSKAC